MNMSSTKIDVLRDQERRKIEFQVSTYGRLAEQEQARQARGRGDARVRVPHMSYYFKLVCDIALLGDYY